MTKTKLVTCIFMMIGILNTSLIAFANSHLVSPYEHGYKQYRQYCQQCHQMAFIGRDELDQLHFSQATLLTPQTLVPQNNNNIQQDLSLLYKQKGYDREKLQHYLADFSNHPPINYQNNIEDDHLLQFIHWANRPYQKTSSQLGIFIILYLLVMLIIWSLWAFKLHHRVIRRYDRYDLPNFPDDAPSSLTKASNDL